MEDIRLNEFPSLSKYDSIDLEDMYDINGGVTIVIAGVIFVGWKAVALIAAGVTTVAGAVGLGLWNGYGDTKNK